MILLLQDDEESTDNNFVMDRGKGTWHEDSTYYKYCKHVVMLKATSGHTAYAYVELRSSTDGYLGATATLSTTSSTYVYKESAWKSINSGTKYFRMLIRSSTQGQFMWAKGAAIILSYTNW
jgi:hypothetical protein